MYGSVIEFYTLTDTDRTRTEYDDFLLAFALLLDKLFCFVFVVEGRIEVGSQRFEFRSAGIYHLIRSVSYVFDFLLAELFYSTVEEAHLLGFEIKLVGKSFARKSVLHFDEVVELMQKPSVNLGNVVYGIYAHSSLQGFVYNENSFVVHVVKLVGKLFVRVLHKLFVIERIVRYLRSSYGFHYSLFEGYAYCHYLARSFHLRAEFSRRIEEFIERPLGEFDYHVVDGRLETSVGRTRNCVFDFVERVAYRYLGSNLCDRITRSL